MATTGFWPVRGRLKDVLTYAENPDKTMEQKFFDEDLFATLKYASNSEKTDEQMYVSGINCSKHRAYEEMCAVKKRYGERGSVVAYHGYQSFRAGEVTPQEAHEIGIETARRMWGDRFQVVVTTHLNTDNLHNHFVINSTSFKDGKKYRNKIGEHKELRRISDEICKSRELSVLENAPFCGGDKKDYWLKKNGIITHRDMLRHDVEEALANTVFVADFKAYMECIGYRFVRDFRYEHPAVITPDWEKAVRIDSLGKNYTKDAIKERLDQHHKEVGFRLIRAPDRKPRQYFFLIYRFRKGEPDLITALFELMLTIIKMCRGDNVDRTEPLPISPEMRVEVQKLDNTLEEYHFLREHNIVTTEDFSVCREKIESLMNEYIEERQHIRNKIRRAKAPEQERILKEKGKALTAEYITPLRKELKICDRIAERTPRLQELMKQEVALESGHFPIKLKNRRNKQIKFDERNKER